MQEEEEPHVYDHKSTKQATLEELFSGKEQVSEVFLARVEYIFYVTEYSYSAVVKVQEMLASIWVRASRDRFR